MPLLQNDLYETVHINTFPFYIFHFRGNSNAKKRVTLTDRINHRGNLNVASWEYFPCLLKSNMKFKVIGKLQKHFFHHSQRVQHASFTQETEYIIPFVLLLRHKFSLRVWSMTKRQNLHLWNTQDVITLPRNCAMIANELSFMNKIAIDHHRNSYNSTYYENLYLPHESFIIFVNQTCKSWQSQSRWSSTNLSDLSLGQTDHLNNDSTTF